LIDFNAATAAALHMILDVMNINQVIGGFKRSFVIRLSLSEWRTKAQ
jgi:hypothetical protein